MMRTWLLPATMAIASGLHGQEMCAPTPLYSVCDITFDLPGTSADSLQLYAEMKSPRYRTVLAPAFPAGGSKWVLRFTPTDPGQYEYKLTSSLPQFNGKTGTIQAIPSEHPGFIRPANVHHWIHPETLKPHLWTGGINHLRVALPSADTPGALAPIETKIRELNGQGITADLILAPTTADIAQRYPSPQAREKWIRDMIARFSAFDITWLIVGKFEGERGARALLKELGTLIKKEDPYNHPRSAGSAMTTSSMLSDGWMDYINIGTDQRAVPAVEHQFYGIPFVNTAPAKTGAAFRSQIWNATMDGQYPSLEGDPAVTKAWREFFERTRFWELEPYFDVDGGRAVALNDVEYIVYVEKPSGPVEVTVEKHGYDVYWFDPATGAYNKEKKDFKGDHFVGEPPTKDHDWVLHLSRDGRKEGMRKSYKFESMRNDMQEVEMAPERVPFTIVEPSTDTLSISKPAKFAVKLKRDTRATRQMLYVWTGEVVADGEGLRVIGVGPEGQIQISQDIARKFPATANLRLAAINANGKAYALDRVLQLIP